MSVRLKRVSCEDVPELRPAVDASVVGRTAEIVESVRSGGLSALRELCVRFDNADPDAPLVVERDELEQAWRALDPEERALLERTTARIQSFASAQRERMGETRLKVPGGWVGNTLHAVGSAGCYAPGGRHPLPSSVLMTVVPAVVAGVQRVVVASPRGDTVTRAAAWIAGADQLLVAGGAHAIGALAYGVEGLPRVDLIVGPGNAWVTAAKKHVFGTVGIDMLAGPSELVVLADESAEPARVAADLLAQAEHDDQALPVLVTTCAELVGRVERELERQLKSLPTAATARAALDNGFAVVAQTLTAAVSVCNRLAPEHLAVATQGAADVAARLDGCSAVFIGTGAAEALGDYGIGPNHVLPTGGGARFGGGLSVATFVRSRSFVEIEDESAASETVRDAARLARLEGLEAHARSAELRLVPQGVSARADVEA